MRVAGKEEEGFAPLGGFVKGPGQRRGVRAESDAFLASVEQESGPFSRVIHESGEGT